MLDSNLGINEKGHLTIGEVDTVELAREYKTPLYVMDEGLIRENMQMYKASVDKYYGGKGLVCYASKAFSCKHIYTVAKEEGIGVDVVSMGELYTALLSKTEPALICYHGSNKSVAEIRFAIENDVGRIVVDAYDELDIINEIAKEYHKKVTVLLRLSPGIEAHTHEFVKTAGIDSKFGFPIETGAAMEAVKHALELTSIKLNGVHCHIGSQIFELEPFEHAAEVLLAFMAEVKKETGLSMADLNLGGGFGIKYTDEDTPVEYDEYMKAVSIKLSEACEKHGMELPFVIIEPGRSIVGSAGITLYEIGAIKEISGVRNYVSVDGGMTDNIRFALYGSKYDFVVANKADKPREKSVAVVGHCCESGDILAKDTKIQECERGDYLAVLATGAYNYSMSSNYNRLLKPAVVMVKDKKSFVAVKRETLDDIVRNDL